MTEMLDYASLNLLYFNIFVDAPDILGNSEVMKFSSLHFFPPFSLLCVQYQGNFDDSFDRVFQVDLVADIVDFHKVFCAGIVIHEKFHMVFDDSVLLEDFHTIFFGTVIPEEFNTVSCGNIAPQEDFHLIFCSIVLHEGNLVNQ